MSDIAIQHSTLAVRGAFTWPSTEEEAIASLTALGSIATATEWARAAIVAAVVKESKAGRPSKENRVKVRDFHTPHTFAALGIVGLKSDRSVRHYLKAWQSTGLPRPVLGEEPELPDTEFPSYEQSQPTPEIEPAEDDTVVDAEIISENPPGDPAPPTPTPKPEWDVSEDAALRRNNTEYMESIVRGICSLGSLLDIDGYLESTLNNHDASAAYPILFVSPSKDREEQIIGGLRTVFQHLRDNQHNIEIIDVSTNHISSRGSK